jgi:hypothetical protein
MTPEEIADLVGVAITPTAVRLDPRSIKPFCAECGTPIDLREAIATDAIVGWKMPDGANHFAALCRRCIQALDAAGHAETLRSLNALRHKAFA